MTRPRTNMIYTVLDRRPVSRRGPGLMDAVMQLTSPQAMERCTTPRRLVTIWAETHQRRLTFLTNIMHLAASTIAAIDKARWQIELFFKALKQNLKVKTFVGTSANAVQVQIWTALIAMRLLTFLQRTSTWSWSRSNLAALLRFTLLSYWDLWVWLDAPVHIPIVEPQPEPLVLQG